MRSFYYRKFQRWMRRNESGQSIIVLAIGFIALVGFVGITTDVSLMFVRYAQLARATDAAAIAAANQMRQDRTQASLGLAARQFIELYGLNPLNVLVDTCISLPVEARAGDELCRDDQAKLVRVTAQIESPTVFMRLLGFENFILQASSVSETAALDVVVIMDVGEFMASLTTIEDWARDVRQGMIYRPPRALEVYLTKYPSTMANRPSEFDFWKGNGAVPAEFSLLNTWQANVNARLYYPDGNGNTPLSDPAYTVQFNSTFFNAKYGPQSHPRVECRVRFFPQAHEFNTVLYQGHFDSNGKFVRLLNNSNAGTFAQSTFGLAGLPWPAGETNWDGFVPTYNYFGCCNDPNGDYNFSDLVCQPFKQARTAVLEFMDRVDFTRGDRMAIVTYDRTAFLVNPYGYLVGGQPFCTAGNTDERCRPGAMMENADDAREALRRLVGVRAEPNFYVYTPGNITNAAVRVTGQWTSFAAGINENGQSIPIDFGKNSDPPQPNGQQFAAPSNVDGTTVYPELYNFPVWNACPFGNAGAVRPDRTLFEFGLQRASIPNAGLDAAWGGYIDPNGVRLYRGPISDPNNYNTDMSYDRWASCRGANVGAGLREGSNALVNPQTIRQSGTVWVMILLASGGAAGSDPVRRNRNPIPASQPYAWNDPLNGFGRPGQYGGHGLCPFGTPGRPAELTLPGNDSAAGFARFPHCSDESPRSRHFCNFRPLYNPPVAPGTPVDPLPPIYKNVETGNVCAGPGGNCVAIPPMGDRDYVLFDPTEPRWYGLNGPQSAQEELAWNRANNNLYDVDLDGCRDPHTGVDNQYHYDADDYARDWADYIALRRDSDSNILLPSIFTIGFGLEYFNRTLNGVEYNIRDSNNAQLLCQLNPGNCLAEQLLRYIADVGDNNQIDNHWYKAMLFPLKDASGNIIPGTTSRPGGFGPRDPCQRQDQGPVGGTYDTDGSGSLSPTEEDRMYGHLAPQTNCGNYYYAPDYNQLQFVFDDIASRMFTRLSR